MNFMSKLFNYLHKYLDQRASFMKGSKKKRFIIKIRKPCKGIINKQISVRITNSHAFYIRKLSKAEFKTKDKKIILDENYKVLNILKKLINTNLKNLQLVNVGKLNKILELLLNQIEKSRFNGCTSN